MAVPAWLAGTLFAKEKEQEKAKLGGGLLRYDKGSLTSAIQKYVRRGMVGQANAVASAMISLGEDKKLTRRLIPIIMEDCGWRKMWLLPHIKELVTKSGKLLENKELQKKLFQVIRAMAEGPKDKDIAGLTMQATGNPSSSSDSLEQLIGALEIEKAATIVSKELRAGNGKDLWGVLLAVAKKCPLSGAEEVVKAAQWRVSGGVMEEDRVNLGIGCLLMLFDYGKGWDILVGWDIEEPEVDREMGRLDWWCLDCHTYLGKTVAGMVQRKFKGAEAAKWIGAAMWYFEATACDSYTPPKYFDNWDLVIKIHYQMAGQDMKKRWEEMRDTYQDCAEWLMKKRNLW